MSDFVGLGILVAAVGSAAIGAGRRVLERRRARRELVTKPALAQNTSEGEVVRVTGIVRVAERTLVAPLSGATCVVVRSRVSAGTKIASRAMKPRESFAMVPFVLEREGEGTVSIEGEHALLDLEPIALPKPRGTSSPERQRRDRFLLAQGFALRQAGRAIFEETIVEPGMRVSVAGLMMKDPVVAPGSEELGFRDAARPALRLAGNVEHPLVIGSPIA